jgi:hypothetical protein
LARKSEEKNLMEDLGIDGRIMLKLDLEEVDWLLLIGFIWLRIGTNAGSCEEGNEPSNSIKFWEFLD